MKDANAPLLDLQKRRKQQMRKRRRLHWLLLLLKWLTAFLLLGVAIFLVCLSWQVSSGFGGVVAYLLFYAFFATLAPALEFTEKNAHRIGFPQKRYDELGIQFDSLTTQIKHSTLLLSVIEQLKGFDAAASPTQTALINSYIEKLSSDIAQVPIPDYHNATYEPMRKSIAAIRTFIEHQDIRKRTEALVKKHGQGYIDPPSSPSSPIIDAKTVLAELDEHLAALANRKRQLSNKRLLPVCLMAAVAAGLVLYACWWISNYTTFAIFWFCGLFFAGMYSLWGALLLGQAIARWLGFPQKEYDHIDADIKQLRADKVNVGWFVSQIGEAERLKERASDNQKTSLDRYIYQLHTAVNETPIPSKDSTQFHLLKRSISGIKVSITRGQRPSVSEFVQKTPGPTPAPPAKPLVPAPVSQSPSVPSQPSVTPNSNSKAAPEQPQSAEGSPRPSPPSSSSPATPTAPTPPRPAVIPPAPSITRQSANSETNPAEPAVIELDLTTVFQPRTTSIVKKITRARLKRPIVKRAIDYLEQYIKNRDIGHLGEVFVLKREKDFLRQNGREDLAKRVLHVSMNNDALGYDILSFDLSGVEKYIEVKTTNFGYESQFFLSVNEAETMTQLPNYFIYRVYNFDSKNGSGSVYKINCAKDFERYFHMETAVYKVIPNAVR